MSYWGYKRVVHLVCGSCSGSTLDSVGRPGPSTRPPSSGVTWAPVWTVAWEASHACQRDEIRMKQKSLKHFTV